MSTQYNKTDLKNVILKIDYDKISLTFLQNFIDIIKEKFPIIESTDGELRTVHLNNSSSELKQQVENKTIWSLFNVDKSIQINISNTDFSILYTNYKELEELIDEVNRSLSPFVSLAGITQINRLGIRYVNVLEAIDNTDIDFFDWNSRINNDLLGGINFIEDNSKTVRNISQIFINNNDNIVKFLYGIGNNNYPNLVNNKEFLLDYDCFSVYPFEFNQSQLLETIKKYNSTIKDLFEKSITEEYLLTLKND